MIYKTDGGYVISSRQVWMPGVAGGQGGVITMNALKKAKP